VRNHQSLKGNNIDEEIPTLEQWLDEWEAAVEADQSSISRQEAVKRYHQFYGDDDE